MVKNRQAFSLIELSIVILIIGILVAGVTQSSRAVKEFKFSTANSLTKSADVNSIPDIALWLETVSDTSFTVERPEDNVQIAQWNDINPQVSASRKTNATSVTSTFQPLYIADSINNLPGLRFDGIDDKMVVATGFDNDTENVTLFLVWKSRADAGTEMMLLEKWDPTPTKYPYALRTTTTYTLMAYDGTNNPTAASVTTRAKDIPIIISGRRLKGSFLSVWINGVKEAADVADNTVGSTTNTSSLGICNRPITGGLRCNGDIGEIIIFSRALKDEERKAVEKYLGKKWGIKVN